MQVFLLHIRSQYISKIESLKNISKWNFEWFICRQ